MRARGSAMSAAGRANGGGSSVSVATRGLTAAGAVALTIGIAAQPSGSAAKAPGSERSGQERSQRDGRSQEHLKVLDRPTDHFHESLAQARRAAERREARQERQESSAEATEAGGFPTPESLGVSSETLSAIAACESGGDPTAVSADGAYHGLYQFDLGTWASVGGSGDPAAASPKEQTYRAALLHSQSGSSPWPVCGL
jgi:TolA-binding protein